MTSLSAMAGLALPAGAQMVPGTIALSPEDRAAVLDAAARKTDTDLLAGTGVGRQVHGEMGFQIGTGGQRAVFGTAVVPLGEDGYAAFSFMTGQQGRWRR